jgi:hypothetical protein
MTHGLKLWRQFVEPAFDAVFGPMGKFLDRRRRKKSFRQPVICGHGRDALRYYENGHYVVIEAELTFGYGGSGRLIYRDCPLKWDDNQKRFSEVEAKRVIQVLCEQLDRRGVRWKFAGVD